jgi:hypothetical protein
MVRSRNTWFFKVAAVVAALAFAVFTLPAYAQAPTGWWMLDDGSGSTAADSSTV